MAEDETKTQLDRIEKAVGTLAEKTTGLEKAVGALAEKTNGLEKAVALLDEKTTHLGAAVDDLASAVAKGFADVEERMATKEDLAATEKRLEAKMDVGFEQVAGKIDGLGRRIDNEVENRAQIETRVRKVEEVVFHA